MQWGRMTAQARKEAVTDYVRRGYSYQQIAEELGCTRNAISGIVHRNPDMQLDRPAKPATPPPAPPAPPRPRFELAPVPEGGFTLPPVPALPPLPAASAPVSFVILTGLDLPPAPDPLANHKAGPVTFIPSEARNLTLFELSDSGHRKQCRWIVSDPPRGAKAEEFIFCGADVMIGEVRPYCPHHRMKSRGVPYVRRS